MSASLTHARPALLILLLAAAIRLAFFSQVVASTVPRWHEVDSDSDSAYTWAQAANIRSGNLLGSPAINPMTRWMRSVGSQDDWQRWWHAGPGTMYQAPLYAYAVATLSRPPSGTILPVLLLQLALGIAAVWATGRLCYRWIGPEAELMGMLLMALARPELALEGLLLRDALALPLLVIGLALLEETCARRSAVLAALAGVTLALATLTRENLLLLALMAPALIAVRTYKMPGAWPRGMSAAIATAIPLTLWVVRNHVVGSPPLSLTKGDLQTIILGTCLDDGCDPIGYAVPSSMRRLFELSAGSWVGWFHAWGQQASAHPLRAAHWFVRKLWGLTSPYEPADNVSLVSLTYFLPVLRGTLATGVFIAPALLGLALALSNPRRRAWLLLEGVVLVGPLWVAPVSWRTRAGLLPVLIGLASLALVQVRTWVGESRQGPRRLRSSAPAAAAVLWLVGATALAYAFPPKPLSRLRGIEFVNNARVLSRQGRRDEALQTLDDYLEAARTGRAMAWQAPMVQAARDEIAASP